MVPVASMQLNYMYVHVYVYMYISNLNTKISEDHGNIVDAQFRVSKYMPELSFFLLYFLVWDLLN